MRSTKIQIFLQVSFIFALTFFMSGCGRTYHIKGRVVFFPEIQSSSGFIVEFTGQELPLGGKPLAGARVKMFHELDKENKPKANSVWETESLTFVDGYFDLSDYANPTAEAKVGLEVSKAGYKTVYKTYTDYSDIEPQVFFIVLVPETQSIELLETNIK